MTKRERLLAALSGNIPDRIPWVADIVWWRDSREMCGELQCEYQGAQGYLRQQEDLGLCAYYNYSVPLYSQDYEDVEIEVRQGDYPIRFAKAILGSGRSGAELPGARSQKQSGGLSTGQRQRSGSGNGNSNRATLRCHEGMLTFEEKYVPESFSWGITKYPVKTPEDLRILRQILDQRRTIPNAVAYGALRSSWGDAGYPSVLVPRSPLPALLTEWAGVENLAYLIADASEEVEKTLQVIEKANRDVFQVCIESRVPLVHFPDNLSSENSAGYFDRYMRSYYQRRLGELHEAGIAAVVHLDGTIKGLLPKLAEVGFDGVEALTPRPVGDTDVEELRVLAGRDDLVLWGGVPGAMFAPPFTAQDMKRHVLRVLETCGHSPFVLGTADQIPPNGDIYRCEMISEIVECFVP